MRRNKTPGGDRVLSGPTWVVRVAPIILAGCVGYLLGSAHLDIFRAADISAAESVASRFPQDWKNASLAAAVTLRTAAVKLQRPNTADASATARNTQQNAFLDPALMTSSPSGTDATAAATIQTASADDTAFASVGNPVAQAASIQPAAPPALKPGQNPTAAVSQPAPAAKTAAVVPHHPVNERPGYVLNDAQIASIKERLHLTPDQAQMWPAVEAALRNIAYTHAQQARGRGATQTAAVDPNAVQNLKSAAVPLILSFNDEQKDEVRNLVHVMGLDQLASQF
jgi:hypothetical protein